MYVILNPDSSFYRRIQSIIQDINNVIDVNVILNPDSSSHWQIQSIIQDINSSDQCTSVYLALLKKLVFFIIQFIFATIHDFTVLFDAIHELYFNHILVLFTVLLVKSFQFQLNRLF